MGNARNTIKGIVALIAILLFASCDSFLSPSTENDGYVYYAIRGWNQEDYGGMVFNAEVRLESWHLAPQSYSYSPNFYSYFSWGESGDWQPLWYEAFSSEGEDVWKKAHSQTQTGEIAPFKGGTVIRVQLVRGTPDYSMDWPYLYIQEGTEEYTDAEYVTVDGDIYVEFHMDDFL